MKFFFSFFLSMPEINVLLFEPFTRKVSRVVKMDVKPKQKSLLENLVYDSNHKDARQAMTHLMEKFDANTSRPMLCSICGGDASQSVHRTTVKYTCDKRLFVEDRLLLLCGRRSCVRLSEEYEHVLLMHGENGNTIRKGMSPDTTCLSHELRRCTACKCLKESDGFTMENWVRFNRCCIFCEVVRSGRKSFREDRQSNMRKVSLAKECAACVERMDRLY